MTPLKKYETAYTKELIIIKDKMKCFTRPQIRASFASAKKTGGIMNILICNASLIFIRLRMYSNIMFSIPQKNHIENEVFGLATKFMGELKQLIVSLISEGYIELSEKETMGSFHHTNASAILAAPYPSTNERILSENSRRLV